MVSALALLLAGPLLLGGEVLWPFPPASAPPAVLADFHTPLATGEARAYLHGGVDLLAPPGTEVRAVTEGWVWVYRQRAHDNIVLTDETGEVWEFRHLVLDSVPDEVLERAAAGLPIEAGTRIGRVPRWGDTGYDHIHLNRRSPEGRVLPPGRFLQLKNTAHIYTTFRPSSRLKTKSKRRCWISNTPRVQYSRCS